jgi:AraC family transcriptional regulator, regulatory protein of adaptative response / DNA-3-methyladenine glycosylase II
VSGRHLRRLFTTHLGVTPDGLARSARTHFARRLLDDTDLTVTEVAFAAGFGSLRQFHRACQEVFRASPQVLRARRRKADRLVADGGLLLRLPFEGPLDWPAILAHLGAHATPGVEQVSEGIYRRTITVGGDPGVLELSQGGGDHLLLRAHLPHWEELLHLVGRARRIASLDLDLDEPARQLAHDPIIGPLQRAHPGVRPPGTFGPFETGVRAVVEQQVPVAAANKVMGRLVERLGAPVPGLQPFGLTHTFPPPEALADADLASLAGLDGFGRRTAHYLALRLGEPDAWPIHDLSLLGLLPNGARDPGTALAERWRPWRTLAAAHLWNAGSLPSLAEAGRVGQDPAHQQPSGGDPVRNRPAIGAGR